MNPMRDAYAERDYRIGIYVRESRDDNEENIETIENQRELLLDFASRFAPGKVCGVYEDDNVSGSAFDRPGLDRLKNDVAGGRVDLLLLKDLSRLGRNNARTLLFIDFLEERGVRLVTFDGRYDSLGDNETAGLETWINERYVRDASRKIRASLRFKIERGEYLGHAPFGYVKKLPGVNRLFVDEENAPTVKRIFELYTSGLGYASIAALLNAQGLPGPKGGRWSGIAVRRILCGRVYTGDTVQGVSERVSFKSRKTRRLPEGKWVMTENTHEAIVSREEYSEVQNIRRSRARAHTPHKRNVHPLHGLVRCGRCGSVMYARKKKDASTAYLCGNYCRNGSGACSSHFVNESEILGHIMKELAGALRRPELANALKERAGADGLPGDTAGGRAERNARQLALRLKQQETLYSDRLEGRISGQLFDRMNEQLEARIAALRQEELRLAGERGGGRSAAEWIGDLLKELDEGTVSNGIIRAAVDAVTVYDGGDAAPDVPGVDRPEGGSPHGLIVIDFVMDKV